MAARVVVVVVTLGFLALAGCNRDVRLSGRHVPTVTVRSVSHFGLTLDEQATPEQVAFVVLRAIREDFLAKDEASREKALAVQFDLCAADELTAHNRTSISRDEFIYQVVHRWTPTVSHYAGDFETDWEAAQVRLVRKNLPATELNAATEACQVLMEVDDPTHDPNARVVLAVWLVRDAGFWRVTHLGFETGKRSIDGKIPPPLVENVARGRSDAGVAP